MNNARKNRQGVGNKMVAIIAAILVHAIIIGAMVINFTKKPTVVIAQDADKVDVVKARAVDDSNLKKVKNEIKKKELEKKRQHDLEKKQLEDLKKASELEKKQLEDLKNKQVEEKQKTERLEKERKEIALKKKKEEALLKKKELERKKKEEARKKREAENKRKELAAKKRLEEALRAEQAFQAEQQALERRTTLASKYAAQIKRKVESRWNRPPNTPSRVNVVVNLRLSSNGDVLAARVVNSTGIQSLDRSIETAVYNSSPLPIPTVAEDAQLHKEFQDVELEFDLEG